MSAGDRVSAETELLPVVKNKPIHVRPDRIHPTALAFDPSTADLAQVPVRVSVWDARITLARAMELRGGGDLVGYVLLAADVDRVAAELASPRLRTVEDPEGAIGCGSAEALWHHGIEGLEKDAWASRQTRTDALTRLAEASRLAT